jgi:DDE superfamily endonuclease
VNATLSCPGVLPQSVPGAGLLAGFRDGFYRCLTGRGDALFSLCDAVLCAGGRVTDLARLSLVPEFGRGHGALYDGLNAGRVDFARVRWLVAALPLPRWADGRIRLAVDVCCWLRPGAEASPGRALCHVHGRGGDAGQVIPGWPYSFVAALGPGASSWAVLLDAARLGPDDDDAAVTAAQLRDVIGRLRAAGHWREGSPEIVIAADAGYNATRLAFALRDLPVIVVARVRSDRVYYRPAPPKDPRRRGKQARLGEPVSCAAPATQHSPHVEHEGRPDRPGTARVAAWNRVTQKVHRHTGGFEDWPEGEPMPLVPGTLIRLSGRMKVPMWLWSSEPDADDGLVRVLWQAYLRRFDIEHVFRFIKQQLGWNRPLLRDPQAADRWTWLIIAACAQLWLARHLAAVTRLPWQPPRPPGQMTPSRVRAGFRRAREIAGTPASATRNTGPGPGRPKGSRNKHKAPRHPVGKTTTKHPKREKTPGKPQGAPTTSRLNDKL